MSNTKPKGFTLFGDGAHEAKAAPAAAAVPWTEYGGSDISQAWDATGREYRCAFARPTNGKTYALHIFARDNGEWVDVPLDPDPTGRGQLQPRFQIVGAALHIDYTYIGWTGNNWIPSEGPCPIPGFAPFVIPFGSSAGSPAPITLPADSPVWKLYTGEYVATDLDTPAELALRFNKLLDAMRVLVSAGLIVKGA